MRKKIILLLITIFVLVTSGIFIYKGYLYVRKNLEQIVISSLKQYAGLNVTFKNIKIGVSEDITITDFKLFDKYTGEVMFSGEKVIVKYDLFRMMFGDKRLTELILVNGNIKFEMKKGNIINIVSNFTDPNIKEYSTPIIEKISVKNTLLDYNDYSFVNRVSRVVSNVNGTIFFNDPTRSLQINASGTRGKEEYHFELDTSMIENSFTIGIAIKNAAVDNTVLQYGYTNKDLSIKSGIADVNIKINQTGRVSGKVDIRKGSLKYIAISKEIENINGRINIDNSVVKINASGEIEKNRVRFKLEAKNIFDIKKLLLKIGVEGNDIDYRIAAYYAPLKEQKLPVSGKIRKGSVDVTIFPDMRLSVKLAGEADTIFYEKYELNNILAKAEFTGKLDPKTYILDENFENKWEVKEATGKYKGIDLAVNGVMFTQERYKFDITANAIDLYDYLKEIEKQGDIRLRAKGNFSGTVENGELAGNYIFDIENRNIDVDKIEGTLKVNIPDNKIESTFNIGEKVSGKYYNEPKSNSARVEITIPQELNVKYKEIGFNITGTAIGIIDTSKNELISAEANAKVTQLSQKVKGNDTKLADNLNLNVWIKGNNVEIKKVEVYKGSSYIKGNGTAVINEKNDFNCMITDSKIYTKDFNLPEKLLNDKKISKFEYTTSINATGKVFGNKENIVSDLDIKSDTGTLNCLYDEKEINGGFSGLKTTLHFEYRNKQPEFSVKGNIKEFNVNKERISDTSVRLNYKNGVIYLNELKNNIFLIAGDIDTDSKEVNIFYSLKNIEFEKYYFLKPYDIQGYIKEIKGDIRGKIESPSISATVSEAQVKYKEFGNIYIAGKAFYRDNKVTLVNIKVDQNTINGSIDVAKKNLDIKANLIENNIRKYYTKDILKYEQLKNINGRIVGEVNIWGNVDDPKVNGTINIDNIYYGENKVPNLYAKLSYNRKKINISKLNFFNLDGEGLIDLDKKDILFKINKDNFNVSEFEFAVPGSRLDGTANFLLLVKGKIDSPSFIVKLDSKKVEIETPNIGKVEINNLKGDIDGNKDHINITKLEAEYNGNSVRVSGGARADLEDYNINMEAQKIDLRVLSVFTKKYIKGIQGSAKVHLNFKKDDFAGNIDITNMGFSDNEGNFKFSNLNGKIILDKDKINLNNFLGRINTGDFDLNGYVRVADNDIKESNIKLNFYNFEYSIDKKVRMIFEGNVSVENKNVTGKVYLKEGEVRGLPEMKNENKLQNEKNPLEDYSIKIDVETRKSITVSIPSLAIIEGIEAYVSGRGRVTIDYGKINFIGTLTADKGVVTVNNNDFRIQKGVVQFDDIKQYLPKMNPQVSIIASTKVLEEPIYADFSGYLNGLTMKLYSTNDKELSNTQILEMLTFNKKPDEKGVDDAKIKELLDKRLSKQVLDPFNARISELVGFDFNFNTTFFSLSSDKNVVKDPMLGAEITAKKPLYGGNLFGNLGLKFSDTEANKIDSYRMSVDYNVRENVSLSLGAGKNNKVDSTNAEDAKNKNDASANLKLLNMFDIGINFKQEF